MTTLGTSIRRWERATGSVRSRSDQRRRWDGRRALAMRRPCSGGNVGQAAAGAEPQTDSESGRLASTGAVCLVSKSGRSVLMGGGCWVAAGGGRESGGGVCRAAASAGWRDVRDCGLRVWRRRR
jgi:hypothetical protein